MPDVHALLSASSSKQWLHCPPSVRLQEGFPNESSVYAEEGTFCHSVCEYKVRKYLKERVKRPQHWGLTPLRKCYDSYISTMKRVDTFLVCTYNPYNSIYFGRA